MKQFFKRLFCRHNYERIDNFMTKFYFEKNGKLIYKCSKCGKTVSVKVF